MRKACVRDEHAARVVAAYPELAPLDIMHLASPYSACRLVNPRFHANARSPAGGEGAKRRSRRVRSLVEESTEGRDLGILGEPRVNVLLLNLALDRRLGAPPPAPPVAPAQAPSATPESKG